jgi:hypothetical protein
MANNFKKVIDRNMWVSVAPAPNAHAAAVCVASDLRNDVSRNPFVYQLVSNTLLNRYNIVTKAWNFVQSPALAGTFGAGAAMAFAPSFGAVGTIAAGATTTSFTLSTALPTGVGLNMLANRGGSGEFGFKIRIIDTTAGKTEERYIVGNSAGTTPTITVDTAFTFTPASGARYELLAGRVFMLGAGTVASNIWRSFEVATNTLSTGLSTTNLPATIATDSAMVVLDEQYVPYDHVPGEGMVKGEYTYDTNLVARKALTATGSGASSLTGQASGGDSVVVANEYRNFQIRIVEDTTTPTAVGQRRIINSHTGGASPVYTMGSSWAVTPSTNAKFVIELPNIILLRTAGNTFLYVYNYSDGIVNNGGNNVTAGSWSSVYFSQAPANNALGNMWAPSWGMQPDPGRNARHSFCYFFRGAATSLDVFDIAGASNGLWTGAVTYDGSVALTTGTSGTPSPFGNEGRMFYMNIYAASGINQMYRFDTKNRVLSPYTPTDWIQAGTAAAGNRMAAYAALDGTDLYDCVFLQAHTATNAFELIPLI